MSLFSLFFNTPNGKLIKCARMELAENSKAQLQRVYFNYHPNYLASVYPPLDPTRLPKTAEMIQLECNREAPGFLDDILPDDWGKKVLSRLHRFRNRPTISQFLSVLNSAPVGAIAILPVAPNVNNIPEYGGGCDLKDLSELQSIARNIDKDILSSADLEKLKLNMFARGSSVGGARPKVMVHENDKAWIAKFNKENDTFNYARVEHACLKLIETVGCHAANSEVMTVGDKDVLLVERFDISGKGGRYHLATANAWLKSEIDQTDPWWSSYDAISQLIAKYSCQPLSDNRQLFTQMLINRCVNNTDDHLRNFSFLYSDGWQLTPAYDVVPSLDVGQYHQLKVGYSDYLPSLSEAEEVHKHFNLTRFQAREIVSQVKSVMLNWQKSFAQNGVSEEDIELLASIIKTN